MCGISGIYLNPKGNPSIDIAIFLKRSMAAMQYRGPDGEGHWTNPSLQLGLGHKRLSIIDVRDVANQPMIDEVHENIIIFNGEIYNYKELKTALIQEGATFTTNSDTEVILKLYAKYGMECVKYLRGMYAFAIWDGKENQLLIFRDPLGIKPLYYFYSNGIFSFCSQVKALIAGLGFKPPHENAGIVGFYLFGNVPEPFTIYKDIYSLEPGHCLEISGDKPPRKHCLINFFNDSFLSIVEKNDFDFNDLDSAIKDTILKHLVSDVPIGIFLSAGLDSTMIFHYVKNALLNSSKSDNDNTVNLESLRGISLGFDEYQNSDLDESMIAKNFCIESNINHSRKIINFNDFNEHYVNLFASMDQPTVDGVNTYFVSLATKEKGLKVALSGLGGDEVFQGYSNFYTIPKQMFLFGKIKSNYLGKFARKILTKTFPKKPKISSILEFSQSVGHAYFLQRALFLPWELEYFLEKDIIDSGLEKLLPIDSINQSITNDMDPRLQVSALEMQWYMKNQLLRDSDWASMAHSVELRVPFVDFVFIKKIIEMQHMTNNRINKDYLKIKFSQQLPSYILSRPKSGFSTPVNKWINQKLSKKLLNKNIDLKHPSRSWGLEVINQFF